MGTAQRSGWLHTFPRPRWTSFSVRSRGRGPTARQAYYHPAETAAVGIGGMIAALLAMSLAVCVWSLEVGLWFYETTFWLMAWFGYGAFLGARWIYRSNVLGQTVSSLSRRQHSAVPVDPDAQPINLGDWDGPVRRRG